eukprot:PhF_6_TR19948/c0_g1_i2/m.29043
MLSTHHPSVVVYGSDQTAWPIPTQQRSHSDCGYAAASMVLKGSGLLPPHCDLTFLKSNFGDTKGRSLWSIEIYDMLFHLLPPVANVSFRTNVLGVNPHHWWNPFYWWEWDVEENNMISNLCERIQHEQQQQGQQNGRRQHDVAVNPLSDDVIESHLDDPHTVMIVLIDGSYVTCPCRSTTATKSSSSSTYGTIKSLCRSCFCWWCPRVFMGHYVVVICRDFTRQHVVYYDPSVVGDVTRTTSLGPFCVMPLSVFHKA